jgi:transposase
MPPATRLNAYRREHASDEAPLTMSERVRLREAERELRELKQKVIFLEKVAAYFAGEPR